MTAFSVEQVKLLPNGKVRVTFSLDPKQSNSSLANDGLNARNYALTKGLVSYKPDSVYIVDGDLQSLDLALSSPLDAGTWTLTVSGVQAVGGANLTVQSSTFSVSQALLQSGLANGAESTGPEAVVRHHLHPGIKQWEPGWSALIAGLAAGDKTNIDNAELIFRQLFKSTASGAYLDKRSAEDGFVRPEASGIGDEVFRKLSISITSQKLVTQSFLDVLEAYYGIDSTRAKLVSSTQEPYALSSGDELWMSVDGTPVVIPFNSGDFSNITTATAIEVAAAITGWMEVNGLKAFALAVNNEVTGIPQVVVYSASLGLESSLEVTGGKAQNSLLFPTVLTRSKVGDSWTVSRPTTTTVRLALVGTTDTDLSLARIGDYVNVYGANFGSSLKGTWQIVSVDFRYVTGVLNQHIDIQNSAAITLGTVAISTTSDVIVYRPTRSDINGSRAVLVSQSVQDQVDVQFPATTLAVARGPNTAAYGIDNTSVAISSIVRNPSGIVTVTTSSNHGLSAGKQISVDGVVPSVSAPTLHAGDSTHTTASVESIVSQSTSSLSGARYGIKSVRLLDGRAVFMGGTSAGGTSNLVDFISDTGTTTFTDGAVSHTILHTTGAVIPTAREAHQLTVLHSPLQYGNVFISGGAGPVTTDTTWYIYNPTLNSYVTVTGKGARVEHVAVELADNRVLVAGGALLGASLSSAEIFTPSSSGGTSATVASMGKKRSVASAIRLSNGKVLMIGGIDYTTGKATETCEIYDPALNSWSPAGSMGYARYSSSLVQLPDGQIMMIGGYGRLPSTSVDDYLTSAEIYDPASGRWHPAGRIPVVSASNAVAAQYLPSKNQVIVVCQNTIEIFDVATRKWKRGVSATLPEPLEVSVELSTNVIIIAGGILSGSPTNSVSIYVPNCDFRAIGELNGIHTVVSAPTPTSLTYSTADKVPFYTLGSGGSITALGATTATAQKGPYIWDPKAGLAVTETLGTLSVAVGAGTGVAQITLQTNEALLFPTEAASVVFGFGTSLQTLPVNIIGRLNNQALLVDYSFTFPKDLPVGTTVTLLSQKAPFVPASPETVGSFYLTDTVAGRIAASSNLDDIVGAGIILNKTIVYPGDRGLGAEGAPVSDAVRTSDITKVFGS